MKVDLIKKLNDYVLSFNKENLPGIMEPLAISDECIRKLLLFLKKQKQDVCRCKIVDDKLEITSYDIMEENSKTVCSYGITEDMNDIGDIILEDLKNQYTKIEFYKIELEIEQKRINGILDQIIPVEERFA